MFQGYDPGFVGESYQAPMTLQDAQDSINFYLEHAPTEKAKMPNALLGCPGLNQVLVTQPGQVRGDVGTAGLADGFGRGIERPLPYPDPDPGHRHQYPGVLGYTGWYAPDQLRRCGDAG